MRAGLSRFSVPRVTLTADRQLIYYRDQYLSATVTSAELFFSFSFFGGEKEEQPRLPRRTRVVNYNQQSLTWRVCVCVCVYMREGFFGSDQIKDRGVSLSLLRGHTFTYTGTALTGGIWAPHAGDMWKFEPL